MLMELPYLTKTEHPLDNLVLSGVAGQPGVDIGDDVDTDRAEEVITNVTTNTRRGRGG